MYVAPGVLDLDAFQRIFIGVIMGVNPTKECAVKAIIGKLWEALANAKTDASLATAAEKLVAALAKLPHSPRAETYCDTFIQPTCVALARAVQKLCPDLVDALVQAIPGFTYQDAFVAVRACSHPWRLVHANPPRRQIDEFMVAFVIDASLFGKISPLLRHLVSDACAPMREFLLSAIIRVRTHTPPSFSRYTTAPRCLL